MKKMISLVLALTLLAAMFAGCGSSTSTTSTTAAAADTTAAAAADTTAAAETAAEIETVTEGKLTVATSPDFAPMEFVDATKSGQDQYVGFDMTLAHYIAEQMGLELVITPMSFDACQTAVAMGSVDMALAGFSWTEERGENFNLSNVYNTGNEDDQVLITLAENGDKYADAANIEGLTVGYQTASLQESMTIEQLPNATGVVFSDITTGIMQLKNGDFDCMAVAKGNADSIIASNPEIALSGFYFEVDDAYTGNVVMMKKGADALTEKVNEILAQAESEDLYTGWYTEAKILAGTGTEVSYDDEGNVIS